MQHSGHQGFTLIELLVVLVIISIVSVAIVLSGGLATPNRDVKSEAQQFAGLLQASCEEALLLGNDYGVVLDKTGYLFVEFEDDAWVERMDDTLYRPRYFSPNVQFELFVEGQGADRDEQNELFPHVACLSSGELTPFEMRLWQESVDPVTVTGLADGTINVVDNA